MNQELLEMVVKAKSRLVREDWKLEQVEAAMDGFDIPKLMVILYLDQFGKLKIYEAAEDDLDDGGLSAVEKPSWEVARFSNKFPEGATAGCGSIEESYEIAVQGREWYYSARAGNR